MISQVIAGIRPSKKDCEDCPGLLMTNKFWNLIDICWHQNPALRPTMGEAHGQLVELSEDELSEEALMVTLTSNPVHATEADIHTTVQSMLPLVSRNVILHRDNRNVVLEILQATVGVIGNVDGLPVGESIISRALQKMRVRS
jgi:hypothetical protein